MGNFLQQSVLGLSLDLTEGEDWEKTILLLQSLICLLLFVSSGHLIESQHNYYPACYLMKKKGLYIVSFLFFFFSTSKKCKSSASFIKKTKPNQYFLPVYPSLSTLERRQFHIQLILLVLQKYSCCYRKSSQT